MQPLLSAIKKHQVFYALGVFVILDILLVLLPSPDHATLVKYHLSTGALRWLELTVIIPSAVTWFATFYGYDRLCKYGELIKDSKDGRAILTISKGLGVFAYGTPLVALSTTAFGLYVRHNAHLLPTQTIIRNYFLLLVPLIAFILIGRGAQQLSELVKSRPSHNTIRRIVLLLLLIGVTYCYLVLKNNTAPLVSSNTPQAYYMPDWLVLFTLVVPYLYIWFNGMLLVSELLRYHRKIKGIIYKRSWTYISRGFIGVITALIIIQYVTSLSGKLNRLHLNSLLALVYALLVMQAVGYILIALGAKKLQKIEEV